MWELISDNDGFWIVRRISLDEYNRLEPRGFRIERCYYTDAEATRAAAVWNTAKARLLRIKGQKMIAKADAILADAEGLKRC